MGGGGRYLFPPSLNMGDTFPCHPRFTPLDTSIPTSRVDVADVL